MGTGHSFKQSNLHQLYNANDWLISQKLQQCQVWCEKRTGRNYDAYKLSRQILNDIAQLQKYQFRKMNGRHLVEIKSILDEDDSFICSKLAHVTLLTERIPYRLKNLLSITFYEALIILKSAASGFNTLYPFYGTLQPTPETICFNQYGYTKVWLNKDLSKNQKPSHEQTKGISTCRLQQSADLNNIGAANRVLSYDRVQKLFTLVQKKTINGFPFHFSKRAIAATTFSEVINLIDQFKERQRIVIVANVIPLQKFDNFIGSQSTIVQSRVLVAQRFNNVNLKKHAGQAENSNSSELIIVPELKFKTNRKYRNNMKHIIQDSTQRFSRQQKMSANNHQMISSSRVRYGQLDPRFNQISQRIKQSRQVSNKQSGFSIQSRSKQGQRQNQIQLYLPLNSDRQMGLIPISSFSSRQGAQSKIITENNLSIVDYRSNSQGNWQRMNRNISRQEIQTDRSNHTSSVARKSYLIPKLMTFSKVSQQSRTPQSHCYFTPNMPKINAIVNKCTDQSLKEQQIDNYLQGQIPPPPNIQTFGKIKSFKQSVQNSHQNSYFEKDQLKQLNRPQFQTNQNKDDDQFNSIKQVSQPQCSSNQKIEEQPFSTNFIAIQRQNIYADDQDTGFQYIPMDQSTPIHEAISPTLSQRRKQRQDRYKKSSFIKQQNSQDYLSSAGVYSNNNLNDFVDSKAICESHAIQFQSAVKQEIEQQQSPQSEQKMDSIQVKLITNSKIINEEQEIQQLKPSFTVQDIRDCEDIEAYIRKKYNINSNFESRNIQNQSKLEQSCVKNYEQTRQSFQQKISKATEHKINQFQIMNMSGSLQVMDLQLAVENKLKSKQKQLQESKLKKRPSLMQKSLQIIDLERTLSKFNHKKEEINEYQESYQSHKRTSMIGQQCGHDNFAKLQPNIKHNLKTPVFEINQENNSISKDFGNISEILRDRQNYNFNIPIKQIKQRKNSKQYKYDDNNNPFYGASNINRAYQKYVKKQNQSKSINMIVNGRNLKSNQIYGQARNIKYETKKPKDYINNVLNQFDHKNEQNSKEKFQSRDCANKKRVTEQLQNQKKIKQMVTYGELRSYLWS